MTESERTLSQQLAAFAVDAATHGVPAEVVTSVGQRTLDVLGLCVAAHRLPTSAAAIGHVLDQGGHEQATIIGEPTRVTAAQAAFANGVLAHSLDYDDTHLPSVLHPSASVVPAALAAAEHAGASGELTVRAIAVGLEVAVRLGMAGYDSELGNSVFFEHGQHATSITGAMGSAVAAAVVYGLDEQGITDVLGLTASMASGVIEANRTGGTVKRLHCGLAAQAGVTAAQLVRRGFTGPPTVLEGRFGFFQAWLHGQFFPEAVTDGLGTEWSVPGIFFKPYPANHFTHTTVDAGRALRERGLTPEQVAEVVVGVAGSTVRTIGEPIEVKRAPETGYQAQFSGPYAFAAGLFGGGGLGTGLDDYSDELAQDPARRALMAKVSVVAHEVCDEIYPFQFPAVVTVTTTSGEVLVEEVLANRGGPARPLTDDELATKFRDNVAGRVGDDVAAQVSDDVLALHLAPDLASVLRPLSTITHQGESQ
ncbi:MmgE/PrpD family protein [Aeromicrobium wangtongii]|uniref:MmgE/PrpD family protein n=1 Tax=Aeromicrobium wangtongii TaxID=2969247 RepID=A0ABY5M6C0_9ACTN|nr:MmgE/PrpD family protein [Aeromicrobium wangtongii]MCD9198596.1 MmgE/PrpD family protein [Aeromicrobium wangtongii]UUP12621.1 MmgE/PrpD family protein [Aeromicrobium wangtongii]